MNKTYIKIISVLSLVLFSSCSPFTKIFLGIKDFKTYVPNDERLEYYKPFFETGNQKSSRRSLRCNNR